jgi:hypothetical protein
VHEYIFKTIQIISCGSETLSVTLRRKWRLRAFEKRFLRRIFGPKREKVTGDGQNYIMSSFMIRTLHHAG